MNDDPETMTKADTLKSVLRLLDYAKEMLIKKNADYSKEPFSNIKASKNIGVRPSIACFIRMTDKWSRLENLLAKEQAGEKPSSAESLPDSVFDLAIYALIFMALYAEEEEGEDGRK